MNQTSISTTVLCRPAQARDRAPVIEFCKGIWDGDDYVPEVWDDWINDPKGILAVAELDGHAIGCSKITWMSEGQWWLEGFRVDPKFQGLKVGSRIHEYVTDWWLEHGDGTLRLMTKANNLAVHRVCEKTGYTKTHEVCGYKAFPIGEPINNFSSIHNLHEAAEFAFASETIKTTDGLTDFGWRIGMPISFEHYANEQAEYHHHFYWWKDKQGVFSFWINEDETQRTMHIGVVACAIHDMPALLLDARRLASQEKLDSVFQIAFDIPGIVSQLEAAGFERHWKHNAFVFQKKHPNG
jgi:GNAT superfamily N-acetyltransferase